MFLDMFVIENVFIRHVCDDGTWAYWAPCQPEVNLHGEGYIVIFPDGEHLHTYRYPPDFL